MDTEQFEKAQEQFERDRDKERTNIDTSDTEEIATTELNELIEAHKKFMDICKQTQESSDHLLKVIKKVVENYQY